MSALRRGLLACAALLLAACQSLPAPERAAIAADMVAARSTVVDCALPDRCA